MQIKQRLEYPIWKTPYFCVVGIFVFFKLVRAGTLTLLIDKPFFNKKLNSTLKFLNLLIYSENKDEVGKKLLRCLINLGPGYIKFGQALSTRPDLVDKKTCEYLKKLQDDMEPFSSSIAKNIIEKDNHDSIDNIFSSFNEKPVANASVAQVHTAILKSGETVAIKILKPNIKEKLFKDFIFFLTASFIHMLEFMAGAITFILSDASKILEAKSSAMPFAIFARKFAVHGIIKIKSTLLANLI